MNRNRGVHRDPINPPRAPRPFAWTTATRCPARTTRERATAFSLLWPSSSARCDRATPRCACEPKSFTSSKSTATAHSNRCTAIAARLQSHVAVRGYIIMAAAADDGNEPITISAVEAGLLRSIAAIIYALCAGKARARQKSVRWWCSRSHLGAL